jgi:hypothetical protein
MEVMEMITYEMDSNQRLKISMIGVIAIWERELQLGCDRQKESSPLDGSFALSLATLQAECQERPML